jgi:hypothetical protein
MTPLELWPCNPETLQKEKGGSTQIRLSSLAHLAHLTAAFSVSDPSVVYADFIILEGMMGSRLMTLRFAQAI